MATGVSGPTIPSALFPVEEVCKTEQGSATHLHLKMGVETALEVQQSPFLAMSSTVLLVIIFVFPVLWFFEIAHLRQANQNIVLQLNISVF